MWDRGLYTFPMSPASWATLLAWITCRSLALYVNGVLQGDEVRGAVWDRLLLQVSSKVSLVLPVAG